MINMPYEDIVERIKESKQISDEELSGAIKKKMDQLSGLISKEGAAYIVANDLGVKLIQTSGLVKIKNIVVGVKNVETAGKVTRVFDPVSFEREGRKGRVQNFMIGDDTGEIRVTAWNDQVDILNKFGAGDTIKIENGYVKTNQDRKEVHLNDRSKITVNPSDINIENVAVQSAPVRTEAARVKINELTDSMSNAEVFATVVQVYDPRFFEQCPECRKRPTLKDGEFVCEQHGTITPQYGYVINAILDDGSDSVRIVCFKEQMQQLFKRTDTELLPYKDSPEKFEELKTDLLGEQVIVVGRVNRNAMFDRIEMVANSVKRDIDPKDEIEKLQNEPVKEKVAEPVVESKRVETPAAVETPKPTVEETPKAAEPEKTEKLPSIDEI